MNIFIIGPGGVGKSTSGRILAELLQYKFIDLDKEFCKEIGNISNYIPEQGYEKYCLENSKLFYKLLEENSENCVFVLSSGFLVHENMDKLTDNHKKTIQEKGLSILLLPSESKEESTDIVIKRQLSRGFGLNEERERQKFRKRFDIYKRFGDIKIYSTDTPENIAEEMKKEIDKQ
ncbi:MAG: shikimate kinase [Candidatus Absconditabacteria bacterium]|nr:shikimate kinase [Candidatus Absconditabacteria bacterium]